MYAYYGYQPYWQTVELGRTERDIQEETEAERMDRIERERLRQAEASERRM
jgi:hypothetical protein